MRSLKPVLLVLLLLASPAAAQTPEAMIRWVYSSLASGGPGSQQGLYALSLPQQRGSYFSRRMVAFYDANDSYGDDLAAACVDFDFSIPGNDYDIAEILNSLRLTAQTTGQKQTVVAEFTTFGAPARVVYAFVLEDGYWKIDDIAGQGFRVSDIPCTPKAAAVQPSPAPANAYCFQTEADSLRLDLLESGAARLSFSSWQSNGHSCSGEMSGQSAEGGWDFHAEQGCRVQLRVMSGGGVRLADQDHVCKFMMCGQRAVIDGLSFPHESRVDCAGWRGVGN